MALNNILNSKGLNLGVKWIEDSEGVFDNIDEIPKYLYETAINFDAYVLNVDRSKSNPNVLFSNKDKKFYLIDFGNAFDCLTIFEDIYQNGDINLTKLFNKVIFDEHYLFFKNISKSTKYNIKFLEKDILDIINKLPNDWKPNSIKEDIVKLLTNRIGNKEIFESA